MRWSEINLLVEPLLLDLIADLRRNLQYPSEEDDALFSWNILSSPGLYIIYDGSYRREEMR